MGNLLSGAQKKKNILDTPIRPLTETRVNLILKSVYEQDFDTLMQIWNETSQLSQCNIYRDMLLLCLKYDLYESLQYIIENCKACDQDTMYYKHYPLFEHNKRCFKDVFTSSSVPSQERIILYLWGKNILETKYIAWDLVSNEQKQKILPYLISCKDYETAKGAQTIIITETNIIDLFAKYKVYDVKELMNNMKKYFKPNYFTYPKLIIKYIVGLNDPQFFCEFEEHYRELISAYIEPNHSYMIVGGMSMQKIQEYRQIYKLELNQVLVNVMIRNNLEVATMIIKEHVINLSRDDIAYFMGMFCNKMHCQYGYETIEYVLKNAQSIVRIDIDITKNSTLYMTFMYHLPLLKLFISYRVLSPLKDEQISNLCKDASMFFTTDHIDYFSIMAESDHVKTMLKELRTTEFANKINKLKKEMEQDTKPPWRI